MTMIDEDLIDLVYRLYTPKDKMIGQDEVMPMIED
jgi:hypothetical protein